MDYDTHLLMDYDTHLLMDYDTRLLTSGAVRERPVKPRDKSTA